MNESARHGILTLIVILVVFIVLAQTVLNISKMIKDNEKKTTIQDQSVEYMSDANLIGSAIDGVTVSNVGIARLCINTPPIITYDCNLSDAVLNMNNTYNCTFTAMDPNGDSFTFASVWKTSPTIFNVSPSGYYNFSPKRSAMNHTNTVWIYAIDDRGCSNSNESFIELNMTVIGTNRPPVLVKNINDEEIVKDHYVLFNLNDYFTDPDGDPLAYFYSITTGNPYLRVRVTGKNVELRGLDCGVSTVYFVAVDPFGLSAMSNTATFTVTCPDVTPDPSGGGEEDEKGKGAGDDARKCVPEWRCSSWSQCQPWNITFKRCVDYQACNPFHYQEYLLENCTYIPNLHPCEEQWDCNEWSRCVNEVHTRMCLDLKACGTNKTKPAESENCSKIASCYNGVKDSNEEDVDCGGPCGACRNLEKPAQVTNYTTVVLLITALTLTAIGSLAYVFRAKLYAFYLKIVAKRIKVKHKIYINKQQKEKLLQMINIIQARLDEHKINHAIDESYLFAKEYFKQLLAISSINRQELLEKIVSIKDKDLEKILTMFYAKVATLVHLRNKGLVIKESEIQALIDEMSYDIYLIAEFTDEEAMNATKNRPIGGNDILDSIYMRMSNLFIALKFGELLIAKKLYKEIMKDYDQLSAKDKAIPYTDIIRAFHAIYYLESQITEK